MDLYPITEKDKEGMWTIHRVPIVEGHLTADVLSQYLQEILKTELLQWVNFFFICDKIVDPYIYCFNRHSTLILIKAKGSVWHKSSMTNGIVPRSVVLIH